MVGVIGGVFLARAIGTIALVARLTADELPVSASPAVSEQPAVAPVSPSPAPAPVPPAEVIVEAAPEDVEEIPGVSPAPKPAPTIRKQPAAPPTATPATKPAKKPGCDPPWYHDKDGEKRFRPECL
jgi:hypothetical protein